MKKSTVFSMLFYALLFTVSFNIDTDLQAQPDIKGSWVAIDKDGNELGFGMTFNQLNDGKHVSSDMLFFPSLNWQARAGKFEGVYTGSTIIYYFRDFFPGTVVKVESTLTYNPRTEILTGTVNIHYDYTLLSTYRSGSDRPPTEIITYNYRLKRGIWGGTGTPAARV